MSVGFGQRGSWKANCESLNAGGGELSERMDYTLFSSIL